jgi:hypothetical protein
MRNTRKVIVWLLIVMQLVAAQSSVTRDYVLSNKSEDKIVKEVIMAEKMKIFIAEDEKVAARRLVRQIEEVLPNSEILVFYEIEEVTNAVKTQSPAPLSRK